MAENSSSTAPQAAHSLTVSSLPHLSTGKVRELYDLSPTTLLFVSTDRLSAYDVVLPTPIPDKGAILTKASEFWFDLLPRLVPGLRTHFVSSSLPSSVPLTPAERTLLEGRSMQVRKLRILPVEAIVRGYLTGSAWKEYRARGTVHGIDVAPGIRQCGRLPEPLYTPSTKAPVGQHDENIHPSQAAALIGPEYAAKVEDLSLAIYKAAAAYALGRGIIIADTKFEFGVDEETGEVVLADEVLTPDSSRFWAAASYEEGRDQESFDKQPVRNWLTEHKLNGKEGVELPGDVVRATTERYWDAYRKLATE